MTIALTCRPLKDTIYDYTLVCFSSGLTTWLALFIQMQCASIHMRIVVWWSEMCVVVKRKSAPRYKTQHASCTWPKGNGKAYKSKWKVCTTPYLRPRGAQTNKQVASLYQMRAFLLKMDSLSFLLVCIFNKRQGGEGKRFVTVRLVQREKKPTSGDESGLFCQLLL